MASIPLGSAQIRLGNDFNQQFFYGDNNSNQLNMNAEAMRQHYSIGLVTHGGSSNFYVVDPIPKGSGVQRNLGMYRGGTGAFPFVDTTSHTTFQTSYAYARVTNTGGTTTGDIRKTNNLPGAGDGGTNIVGSYVVGTSSTNAAQSFACDFGYLEPGNYKFAFEGGSYNTGVHYGIVRGYSGEHMGTSSTNYKVISKNCYWAGGWAVSNIGTAGADFTVNSTYPYVIIALETHNQNAYYLATSVTRKDSTGNIKGNSGYVTSPNMWRVS